MKASRWTLLCAASALAAAPGACSDTEESPPTETGVGADGGSSTTPVGSPSGSGSPSGGGSTSTSTGGGSTSTGGTAGQGGGAGSGGAGGAGLPAGGYGGQLVGGNLPGMVDISGATFWMGCNDVVDTQCNSDETPYHQVTLGPYSIDATEVTRAAYSECVVAGYCGTPPCDYSPTGPLVDHPVTCVTWSDAHRYCDFAGKRLPTEAEWEYAARGDTESKYPWGNGGPTCALANMNLCSYDTDEVGSHPTGQSPFGVLDLAGNVDEWVADYYRHEYYAVSPSDDPTGPASGALRVLRGGGWNSAVFNVRASNRDANLPTHFDNETGFRCALSL